MRSCNPPKGMTMSPKFANGDHRILFDIIGLEAPAIRRKAEAERDIADTLSFVLLVT